MLRGNVDTRLRKQREGVVDATVLAVAGLKRLGIVPEHSCVLDARVFLPAIGQGALGIETRADDTEVVGMLKPLHHKETALAVSAERSFLRRMGGSCRTPLAAKGELMNGQVSLIALIARSDGQRVIRGEISGALDTAEEIGAQLADHLLAQGGHEILAALANG
jgi:hydroxymethylbilane synthase